MKYLHVHNSKLYTIYNSIHKKIFIFIDVAIEIASSNFVKIFL